MVSVFIPASILLPTWGRTDGLFWRWKPGGALIVPSAKCSRSQEGLFPPHTKFSSAEVLVLSTWLRLSCSSLIKDPAPQSSASCL